MRRKHLVNGLPYNKICGCQTKRTRFKPCTECTLKDIPDKCELYIKQFHAIVSLEETDQFAFALFL